MNEDAFKNKLYLILGGSSGIGFATAEALIQKNARVVIAGRSDEKLSSAAAALGKNATKLLLDIADEKAQQAYFASAPVFDGIVCTAGETPPGSIDKLDIESAKHGFDSKFWGQYFVVKYGKSCLKDNGSIVLTGGVFSVRPRKDVGVLAAVNGAIESFVRAMAVELAPLRINALAPGFIETPRLNKVSAADPKLFQERLKTQVPLGRVGDVSEAALSILYLLSNNYTTGTTIYIDGGISLR